MSLEREDLQSDILESDDSDSYHSAEEEDTKSLSNDSPVRCSGRVSELSQESSSSPSYPVIEPDGQESTLSEENLHPETRLMSDGKSEEEDEEEIADDFVDEEYLKDLEIDMSEEEKIVKREESLEHKERGNNSFKSGEYHEAVTAYTAGLRICPMSFEKDRAILYSNRAAAKAKLDRKKEAIKDCDKAVELHSVYTKAILRRATLHEETQNLDEALQDFKRVLELDPSNQESLSATRRLPDMINERNEKLKEEMMGKLKDLGNLVLRPFGLSTANFEMKQDPSSGGYNIAFKQNPNS